MLTPRTRAKLDNLLAADLGRNRFGEANYKWQFSETFLHNMVIAGVRNWDEKLLFDDAGQPVMDEGGWKDEPVVDEAGNVVFDDNGNARTIAKWAIRQKSIITLSRVTAERKMCPQLDNQWLLSIWKWTPEPVWRAKFGTDLIWPARGMYFPVDGSALHPGLEPTVDITLDFIRAMRQLLQTSEQELIDGYEKAVDLEEKHAADLRSDIIDDLTTAFGHAKPGSRSGGVSMPTPEFTKGFEQFMEKNDITAI
jgi:hypothetical protein